MWGLFPRLLKSLVFIWRCIIFTSMMDGNDGGGAAEDQEPWKTDLAHKTRSNSPLKRQLRASPVWGMIKRLDDDHPKTGEGFTHTCIHEGCGCFLKLKKTAQGNWPTSKCVNHTKASHPSSDLAKGYLKTAQTAKVAH